VDTNKQDRYGRSVGKVLLNGEDVNLKQVSAGLAWVYTDYIKELSVEDRQHYRAAETAANDAHIGLWQDEQPMAPWTYRKTK
jgi:endonuclease YncB( thermonuclease family)